MSLVDVTLRRTDSNLGVCNSGAKNTTQSLGICMFSERTHLGLDMVGSLVKVK